MITNRKQAEDLLVPKPNQESPGSRPGKKNQEDSIPDDDDPLFEEDEQLDDFELDEEDDEGYEINDRFNSADFEEIRDYMNSSL